MASVSKNIIANLVGKTWSAALTILFIPYYIKYLGIESYGLVGFYGTLLGTMVLLDLGLSTTVKRELAMFQSDKGNLKDLRNMLFSLEAIYWAIGILISLFIIFFSDIIVTYWINVESLPHTTVKNAVMLMGCVIAFQWPIILYDGALTGLNKQVTNNIITVIMTSLRSAGAILVLMYYSSTITSFFLWQAAISFIYVMVMRVAVWKSMPRHEAPLKISKQEMKRVWRFAASMTAISFVTFFLAQIDKIVLSKILPLSQFGYYTLAFTVSTGITMIASPLSVAFFPKFTALYATGNYKALVDVYHKACKLISVIIYPISFFLIFFMPDILLLWTQKVETTENTYFLCQLLILGSTLNALMIIPYNIIIAKGWTKFVLYQNIIAVILLTPLLFWWTSMYGAVGAAYVWIAINAGYVLISIPLMHKKLLPSQVNKWYIQDNLLILIAPLLMSILIRNLQKYFFPDQKTGLLHLGIFFSFILVASALSSKDVRVFLQNRKWAK